MIPGPFSAGHDLSAAAVLIANYLQANYATGWPAPPATLPAGTDLTFYGIWNSFNGWTLSNPAFPGIGLQYYALAAGAGGASGPASRSAAGLPTTRRYIGNGSTAAAYQAGDDNQDWLRQREREIHSTSAAFDMSGNAATAGQIARLAWTGSNAGAWGAFYPFLYTGVGTVWRFNGTAWAPAPGSVPDLIDNSQSPPNCVSYFLGGNNVIDSYNGGVIIGPDGSADCGLGCALPGDVITSSICEELRLCLNLAYP